MAKLSIKQKMSLILVALLGVSASAYFIQSKDNNNYANADTEAQEEQTVVQEEAAPVTSYKEVFINYYKHACAELETLRDDYSLTFEDFVNGYYYNGFAYNDDVTLADYTEVIINYVAENRSYNYETELFSTYSSSSGDRACYFESYTDYITTPSSEFKYQPIYTGYDGKTFSLKSIIAVGDIIHETKAVAGFGHTAIVVNVAHNSGYGTYIQTIEALGSNGVCYGFLDDKRMVDYGIEIYRVDGINSTAKTKLNEFLKKQVGKSYSLNPFRTNTSIDSNEWFCSELIYAAYNYAGLNLVNRTSGYTHVGGFLPVDVTDSEYTYFKNLNSKEYLDIKFINKVGINFKVRIYNNSNNSKTIYYNSKVCFENDAKSWNLSDVTSFYLPALSYKEVVISANWFAGTIAISNIYNNKRYITYCTDIVKNTSRNSYLATIGTAIIGV